jgi:hypothetical protein
MSGLMTQALRRSTAGMRVASIPSSLMVVVQNVMSTAWRFLLQEVEQGSFSICKSTEDQITERLHMILGALDAEGESAVAGLSQLQCPIREGNVRNYDGTKLDKQADLTFRPIRNLVHCGNTIPTAIFIECKPIDAKHPVPSIYCRDGLVRFVNGDYAWGVDRAIMVGYVRNVCALPGGLSTALVDFTLSRQMQLVGKLQVLPNTISGDTVCQSMHGRQFQLPGMTTPVGQIVVHHLWLKPTQPCDLTKCRNLSGNRVEPRNP